MNIFIATLVIYFMFVLGIGLVIYIFNAIGLVSIARHHGISGALIAWVPFLGTAYVTGAIADEQSIREKGIDPRMKFWLLAMSLALTILTLILYVEMFRVGLSNMNDTPNMGIMVIMLLTVLIGLPFTVLWYVAHYRLFKACQPNNSTLFTILSVAFSLAPFLVFAVRNYKDGQRVA